MNPSSLQEIEMIRTTEDMAAFAMVIFALALILKVALYQAGC